MCCCAHHSCSLRFSYYRVHFPFSNLKSIGCLSFSHKALSICWWQEERLICVVQPLPLTERCLDYASSPPSLLPVSQTHMPDALKRGKMAIEQELLIGKTGKWWQKRQGEMQFSVTRSNWFFFSFTSLIYLSDQGQHTQTDYINCKPSTWLIASYALHLILHLYFKSIHFFFTQF